MNFKFAVFIALVNILDYAFANQEQNYSNDDFTKYTIIHPKLKHRTFKQTLDHTLGEDGLHLNDLILTYTYNNTNVIIDLQLNNHLIPDGHYLTYQNDDGENVVQNLTKIEIDMCHYHGVIRGIKNSRVAISTCTGITGIIFADHNVYHIKGGPDSKINSEHYLYNHEDLKYQSSKCGNARELNRETQASSLHFGSLDTVTNRILRSKRGAELPSDTLVREPYNSNEESIYIELLVVVDNQFYKSKNKDIKKVHAYVKELVNIVNSFYVPLNIFISLRGVMIWTQYDQIKIDVNATVTLSKFVKYRENELLNKFPNDNAHLLAYKSFGSTVGIAYQGLICTDGYSGGITTAHSQSVTVVATTMAHEIGHNLGMEHDDYKYCNCVDEACLMVDSTSSFTPTRWSSCSLDSMSTAFNKGVNYCLKNKPKQLFASPVCGNGFLEAGEECDCGLAETCNNRCCNSRTCKLHKNAACAIGKCCNLNTCQLQIEGYECRRAKGECDLPEYCSGKSEFCPKNVFKRDTEPCTNGLAYCYNGSCTSLEDHCKLLWGSTGTLGYQCYDRNIKGNEYGNCGVDRTTNEFIPCLRENVFCGLLHCKQLNDKLLYGQLGRVSETGQTVNGHVIRCRTVFFDMIDESKNPALAPNGAKCGKNKMCLNKKCLSIDDVRAQGIGADCPDNCNGNGVCNSEGNCHCNKGYAPPTCKDYGAGGSIDSGFALINTHETSRLATILVGMLLLLVLVLLAFGIMYWRRSHSLPSRAEVMRKVSTVPKEIVRRVSIAPREFARRVSNNLTNLQIARSRLQRTQGPYSLADSQETIFNPHNI